mmetsp:Transcript_30010/g.84675  ORF Transcript_30010/g.84675 Transcript_30010/m.84675 type:complete len:227 (+) Transcript_30010:1543-2223(+)
MLRAAQQGLNEHMPEVHDPAPRHGSEVRASGAQQESVALAVRGTVAVLKLHVRWLGEGLQVGLHTRGYGVEGLHSGGPCACKLLHVGDESLHAEVLAVGLLEVEGAVVKGVYVVGVILLLPVHLHVRLDPLELLVLLQQPGQDGLHAASGVRIQELQHLRRRISVEPLDGAPLQCLELPRLQGGCLPLGLWHCLQTLCYLGERPESRQIALDDHVKLIPLVLAAEQ